MYSHAEYMRKYRRRPHTHQQKLLRLLNSVRKRAKAIGVPYNITLADLEPLPTHCPITGAKLIYGGWNDWNAASIDRKVPKLGYVPGNVRVLSRRANMIRFDCLDPLIFMALASDARDIIRGLS